MSAVLIPTSSEAEWLEARRKGITASEIAVVMGLSPYSSPYKLYHQKTGVLPPDDETAAMERGKVLESYIADKFAKAHPEFALLGTGRELFAHPDRPWQMATPDRNICELLTVDPYYGRTAAYGDLLAVLECKTDAGSEDWGEDGTDEIPVHYRAQVLWQMNVMGVETAHVACLRIRDWKLRTYLITLDDAAWHDLSLMIEAGRDFLDQIDTGDAPDVDYRPATSAALRMMHTGVDQDREVLIGRQLAISYRAAQRRYKEAEQRKDELTNRLLAAMGTAQYAVDARTKETIASRSVSHPRRVSTALLRERYPAIAAECTPDPKPQVKLTPAKPKEAKTS